MKRDLEFCRKLYVYVRVTVTVTDVAWSEGEASVINGDLGYSHPAPQFLYLIS